MIKLRDQAIQLASWLLDCLRSLSSGAHSRDPLARNDEVETDNFAFRRHECARVQIFSDLAGLIR
jgi:hypothetical protein